MSRLCILAVLALVLAALPACGKKPGQLAPHEDWSDTAYPSSYPPPDDLDARYGEVLRAPAP